MKRIISGFLALLLAVSSLGATVFAADTASDRATLAGQGTLGVVLWLAYPEEREVLDAKGLQIQLTEGGGELVSLPLNSAGPELKSFPVNGETCTARVSVRNPEDGELENGGRVGYIHVDFEGLPNNQSYQATLTGRGYKAFRSPSLELKSYSISMLVSTNDGGFTMGDADGDGSVDKKDLDLVSARLGKAFTGVEAADLNGDGKVDIMDIALVNHNLNVGGGAEITETQAIAAAVAQVQTAPGVVLEGNAGDVLRPNTNPVKFALGSESAPLSIPVEFSEPVEMRQVTIESPDMDGALREGTATVTYLREDGTTDEMTVDFSRDIPEGVHLLARSANTSTVVIDLGKRVAVKKITITVTKVEDGKGGVDYAVIDEIKFIKNIVPENPQVNSAVPKDLTVTKAEDGSVTLTWRAVSNVEGYEVRYGTASGLYTKHGGTVETTKATVGGLDNLKDYYFVVCSVSGGWSSAYSAEVKGTPQPTKAPPAPDNLVLTPDNKALFARWGKTKDAQTYSVYYRKAEAGSYVRAASGLTDTAYAIGGLENGVVYQVYVTASNRVGESKSSLVSKGTPKMKEVVPPKIPTLGRIPSSEITAISMKNPNNTYIKDYPNGFDIWNVADGDYTTHWTAKSWSLSREFTFTFDDEKSMNYLVYVPRLDDDYPTYLNHYAIKVRSAQEVQENAEFRTLVAKAQLKRIPSGAKPEDKYTVLTFPKDEHIKQLSVEVGQWDGAGNVSLSEIAFYEFNDLSSEVQALFANKSLTVLRAHVTPAEIDALEARVSDSEGYFVDREIMLDELSVARGLLSGDKSMLGRVLDGIDSRNTAGDIKPVNTFQPLGVVANSGSKVVIYADIPEGEAVQVVPTQYYAEASAWAGGGIPLTSGRNVISVPQLGSVDTERGGALYLQYKGDKQEQIRLQVRGAATLIPTLELSGWNSLDETERRAIISDYVSELESYYLGTLQNKMGGRPQTFIRNSTEISLPNVLLSIPAAPVYDSLKGKNHEERVNQLYHNAEAWNDLIRVLYRTHGIDDPSAEHSRQNIRYARMFAGAFMYASGAHIGIGYGSASGLVQGRPVSVTGAGNANGMYGWGIAHEIGHVLDTIGKAEITNNIYSLFAQTYDGGDNALKSRLEGGTYDAIFQKTATASKGEANNVFVALGMYWQLHLAYDGPDDNFYNRLNKIYHRGSGEDGFALAAAEVADRDLTEFFAHWGVQLSDSAKDELSGYPKEDRAIWYLNDQSRRERLAGRGAVTVEPTVSVELKGREAVIEIGGPSGGIQGYEIKRNGKGIAFTSEGSFTDNIGSANNIELVYTVTAIDLLGNVAGSVQSDPVKLSADNVVPRDQWQSTAQEDGSILVTFAGLTDLAGIRVKTGWALTGVPDKEPEQSGGQVPEPPKSDGVKDSGPVPADDAGDEEAAPKSPPAALLSGDSVQMTRTLAALVTDGDENDESTGEDEPLENDSPTGSDDEAASDDESAPASSAETDVNGEDENVSQPQDKTAPDDVPETERPESPPEQESEPANSGAETLPGTQEPAENKDTGFTVAVSADETNYITALSMELKPEAADRTYLFTREGSEDGIGIYETKTVRITGLPSGLTLDSIDFLSYAGDNIDFLESGIGRLTHDYDTGDGVIDAGTIVVAGTYRGDPVYNTIRVEGRFQEIQASTGGQKLAERAINGEVYLFATMPGEGGMAEIDGGIWLFVPDVQKEEELVTNGDALACTASVLPAEIRAVLYRTDDPDSASSKREVSNTLWISSPTEETMPGIALEGETE